MFILTIHLSTSACWVNGQIYCLTRWALSSLVHPPSPASPGVDGRCQYTDTDLGLSASAGGGHLLGQASGTGEESGQFVLTPACTPHRCGPQSHCTVPYNWGGTDHRPGVPPKLGKVRGSRRWGSWVQAHWVPACPVMGRLAAIAQESLCNYKGQSVYQWNELVGRASGPCKRERPTFTPRNKGHRSQGCRSQNWRPFHHLPVWMAGADASVRLSKKG